MAEGYSRSWFKAETRSHIEDELAPFGVLSEDDDWLHLWDLWDTDDEADLSFLV